MVEKTSELEEEADKIIFPSTKVELLDAGAHPSKDGQFVGYLFIDEGPFAGVYEPAGPGFYSKRH